MLFNFGDPTQTTEDFELSGYKTKREYSMKIENTQQKSMTELSDMGMIRVGRKPIRTSKQKQPIMEFI